MPTFCNPPGSGHHRFPLTTREWSEEMKLARDPGVHVGHITVYHQGHMIALSGFKGYKENMATFYRSSDEIWVYDQIVEKWIKKVCTVETNEGDLPKERSGATGTVIGNHLYMFGGYCEDGNLNTLHRLDLVSLKWRKLHPTGIAPLACDKSVSWEYEGKLYLFAGYGRGPDPTQWPDGPRFQFTMDFSSQWHYRRGWNNQLVCYDPETNCWSWPECTGTVPQSRAGHAVAKIGQNVYIFGGRNGSLRMNDMYVLNMVNYEWQQIFANGDPANPVTGRSWHTLTPLSEHSLVLYGGFSHNNVPLNDCWLFHTPERSWTQINLSFNRPRLWHSACLSSTGEIFIYGGAIQNIVATLCQNHLEPNFFARDMFSIQFQPKSLFKLCLSAIASKNDDTNCLQKQTWNELPSDLQIILDQLCMRTPQQ